MISELEIYLAAYKVGWEAWENAVHRSNNNNNNNNYNSSNNNADDLFASSTVKLLDLIKQRFPQWSLSENRLRKILKLSTSACFDDKIINNNSSNDSSIEIKLIDCKKGRGAFATVNFDEVSLIIKEKPTLYFPRIQNIKQANNLIASASIHSSNLVNKDSAIICDYCLKAIPLNSAAMKLVRPCPTCPSTFYCKSDCYALGHLFHSRLECSFHKDEKSAASLYRDWKTANEALNWNATIAAAKMLFHMIFKLESAEPNQSETVQKTEKECYSLFARFSGLDARIFAGAVDSQLNEAVSKTWHLLLEVIQAYLKGKALSLHLSKCIDLLSPGFYARLISVYQANNVQGGIFPNHCFFNHSCDPNVSVFWLHYSTTQKESSQVMAVYDELALRAIKKISIGEEMTISYVDPSHPVRHRRYLLKELYGFECNCIRCINEENSE